MVRKASKSVRSERRQPAASVPDEVLDVAGAADLLKVHPSTVRRLAASGVLPSAKIGREYRFTRSALLRHLEEHRKE